MTIKTIGMTICAIGVATAFCLSQEGLTASDIKWESFMGKRGSDEHTMYILMAQGFMGWPGLGGPKFPDELDTEIADWVVKHPRASVVPIQSLPLSEDFSFKYVWLVDGVENLNLNLVRKGLCDSENMMADGAKLLIEKPRYEQFRHSILDAEQLAIKDKLGIWARPGMEGESHWKKAELLEEQGKLEAAIEEFKTAAALDEHKRSSAWFRIGKLYEKLGRPEAAIEALDRSISTETSEVASRFAQIEKARLLAGLGRVDSTREVFGDLTSRCVDDLTPCMDAAVSVAASNPAKSVQILEPPLLALVSKHEIVFVCDAVQFDSQRAKRSDKYWMALHEAASAFTSLAGYCLAAGDIEKALHHSAKGISIKQNTWGAMAEQLDPLTMEAASFEGRIVRAQAFIAKKMFDEAKRELDYAKVLVDTGQIQGGFVNEQLDHAYAELGKAFPDRKVDTPPKYVPTPKQKSISPAMADLQRMEGDQLVAIAAGTDNGASFAALEELVGRHKRGELSELTTKKLIADGLTRLSSLKAEPLSRRSQNSFWRAQYGVFIENALRQNKLSEEDRTCYLKNMLGISIDFGRMEVSGSAPLSFSMETDPRVAGSAADRGSMKARWTGTIRVSGGTIDGKPVSIQMGEDNTETMELESGSIDGIGCNAKGFETLTPGMHTLTVQGQIEIREGDLGFRTEPEDLAKVEPVSRHSFTASAEFEVKK